MTDLKKLNVKELKYDEMKSSNGGNVRGPGWLGVGISVVLFLLSGWDDLKDGFNDGYDGNGYNYNP